MLGILVHVFANSKYLKSIADTTVIECDEIIIVMDNLSTNVISTASIN